MDLISMVECWFDLSSNPSFFLFTLADFFFLSWVLSTLHDLSFNLLGDLGFF